MKIVLNVILNSLICLVILTQSGFSQEKWKVKFDLDGYIQPPFGVSWDDKLGDVVYKVARKFKPGPKSKSMYLGFKSHGFAPNDKHFCGWGWTYGEDETQKLINDYLAKKYVKKVSENCSLVTSNNDLSLEEDVKQRYHNILANGIYKYNNAPILLPRTKFVFLHGVPLYEAMVVRYGTEKESVNIKGVPYTLTYVFQSTLGILRLDNETMRGITIEQKSLTRTIKDLRATEKYPFALPLLLRYVVLQPMDRTLAKQNFSKTTALFKKKGSRSWTKDNVITIEKGGSNIVIADYHITYINDDLLRKVEEYDKQQEVKYRSESMKESDLADEI